jgi:hypothetical protein
VPPLRYGQIVLANVDDGHGHFKKRPVVIVTPTTDIEGAEVLQGVCISTQIEDPSPPDHVKLPWHRSRHPRTGLDKRNVAKCTWTVEFPRSEIVRVMGEVPLKKLGEIAAILARLASESEGR